MAPGLAHVRLLEPSGEMTVAVLDTAFRGRWRSAASERDTALLRSHWQGTRAALERARARLAVADLRTSAGMHLHCEFLNDPHHPVGVCEESGLRLYYLAPAPEPK